MKRRDMKLDSQYMMLTHVKGYGIVPATYNYRKVTLIELRSGNRAVVHYDAVVWDRAMWLSEKQAVVKLKLIEISCSRLLASVEDWDSHEKKMQQGHLVIDRSRPIIPSPEWSVDREQLDALRRGESIGEPA